LEKFGLLNIKTEEFGLLGRKPSFTRLKIEELQFNTNRISNLIKKDFELAGKEFKGARNILITQPFKRLKFTIYAKSIRYP